MPPGIRLADRSDAEHPPRTEAPDVIWRDVQTEPGAASDGAIALRGIAIGGS